VPPTLHILPSVASMIKIRLFQVRCAVLVAVDQQVKMKQMVMKTRLVNVPTQTMESQTQTATHVLCICHLRAMHMIQKHSFQVNCAASVEEVLHILMKQMVMKIRLVNVQTQTMVSQTDTATHVLNIRLPGAMDMMRIHSFQVNCAVSVVEVLIPMTLQMMTHLLI
jgi:hypothetical protein